VGSLWRHRDGHKLPTTVPQGAVTLPTVGDQAVSLIGAAEVALSNGKAVITVIPGVVGRLVSPRWRGDRAPANGFALVLPEGRRLVQPRMRLHSLTIASQGAR
jgi:hypothetical protein